MSAGTSRADDLDVVLVLTGAALARWRAPWTALRAHLAAVAGGARRDLPGSEAETPLRAELLSTEQMAHHGRALSDMHIINGGGTRHRLLVRLDENEHVLVDTCDALSLAARARQRIAPAGVWLLDNFPLIEEQIRTARMHLPAGYSRELPRLAAGPSHGLPRVYDIALAAISHGDGRVDAQALGLFLAAYQDAKPLSLGELWAIPIMLRLALIENLRRVCARLAAAREYSNAAQDWAERMLAIAESDPKNLIVVIADMARSSPPLVGPFIAELARRLQGHGTALALPLTWIEQRLAESSLTIEQMVLAENQQQAADQVSISNSIGSLRFLGTTDWRAFVERMSVVEQVLAEDPVGAYSAMEFATRDRYRHVIENIARRCTQTEVEVARAALDLACRAALDSDGDPARCHIGYFLIARGVSELERTVEARRGFGARLRNARTGLRLTCYLGAIVILSALYTAALSLLVDLAALAPWQRAALGLVALVAASQLASVLVNWAVTLSVAPRDVPRMDYSEGIPAERCTLVVVPTLLTTADNVDAILEALEVRFLGNQDAHLGFALLTDLCDAPTEQLADDAPLVARARAGIEIGRAHV